MKKQRTPRIMMILENESFPEDTRVFLEAHALADAGYEVTVVCPTGSRKQWHEVMNGVRVYRYPRPWEVSGFVGYVYEFGYSMTMAFIFGCIILVRHGFDVVHVHTPPDMNALVAICFRLLGKRIAIDHHDLSPELYQAQCRGNGSKLLERALRMFEWIACRSASKLIATNESQQRVEIARTGVSAERCHVVRNGPNEQFMGDVEPFEEYVDEDRSVIGFVGMTGVQDGVEYFIEALAELKSRRDDFRAMIVGNGPALESLKQLTDERRLNDFVLYTDFVPFADVPRYIASFDICVTPDPSNAYNDSCTTIKMMEYMALGKPTVAFATSENQITAGDAALYAEDNDVNEFSKLLEQLMDDAELRQSMGEIGRTRVRESLAWEHQRNRLVEMYDELFARTTRAADVVEVTDSKISESEAACSTIAE